MFYFDASYAVSQVVSYAFKEGRFASLHRDAIAFPASRFFYVGTPAAEAVQTAAREGEAKVRVDSFS